MKELLENYILSQNPYLQDYDVLVVSYDIDGAVCEVYYTGDYEGSTTEKTNINIWDMLAYLHENGKI
jgi:hypothetical protein